MQLTQSILREAAHWQDMLAQQLKMTKTQEGKKMK